MLVALRHTRGRQMACGHTHKVATRCRVAHRPEEPEDMHHRNLLLHPRHMHRPQREARPQRSVEGHCGIRHASIYINDAEIPASEELEAEISTPAGKKTVKGTRGEPVSVTVDAVEGTNVVDVTVRNTNGAGQTSEKVVRCGIDTPVDPVVTTRVSDDNTTINLTRSLSVKGRTAAW